MITTNKFQLDKKLMASLFGEELVSLHYTEKNKSHIANEEPNFKANLSGRREVQPSHKFNNEPTKREPVKEKVISPVLTPCNRRDFIEKVLVKRFGMGSVNSKDYEMKSFDGVLMKSWITVDEAVQAASLEGYLISKKQAQAYLDFCVNHKYYICKDTLEGRKYIRYAWCGSMPAL